MKQHTVSIIGTSGRKDAIKNLTPTLFNRMVAKADETLDSLSFSKKEIMLVSGGAAWSDHVAVSLFLTGDYGGLKLYLPSLFDKEKVAYYDTGVVNWKTNPGGTANYYFRPFSKIMERNMLEDLKKAQEKGALFDTPLNSDGKSSQGFHGRNTLVAQSDVVIAFTWGEHEPTDGGTKDTWKKVPKTSTKIHISLSTL